MELKSRHLDAARRAGACAEALGELRAGQPVDTIDSQFLQWAEDHGIATPLLVESAAIGLSGAQKIELEILGPIPAALLGTNGDGYGYGDGYGDGYGYGYGDGYGGSRAPASV